MRWKHLPIVAFDTETTGLSPFQGDKVIEFAAVVLHLDADGNVASQEDHSFLVNPGMEIPRKVQQLTGISNDDVADKPPFAEVADQIRDLLTGAVTVAHNYPFDLAFLSESFKDLNQHWPEPLAEIDTVDLSIRCFPDVRGHKLGDVAKRLDVSLDNAHRATDDAAACGRIFCELARRHNVADDLQQMLDWAGGIGRPPEDGAFTTNDLGQVVFRDGPHEGKRIIEHPIHLAWIDKARVRNNGTWAWRYGDTSRSWARRWLNARGAGRASGGMKSFRQEDWVLDSCIADPPLEQA